VSLIGVGEGNAQLRGTIGIRIRCSASRLSRLLPPTKPDTNDQGPCAFPVLAQLVPTEEGSQCGVQLGSTSHWCQHRASSTGPPPPGRSENCDDAFRHRKGTAGHRRPAGEILLGLRRSSCEQAGESAACCLVDDGLLAVRC
jgi:hypothetical protein